MSCFNTSLVEVFFEIQSLIILRDILNFSGYRKRQKTNQEDLLTKVNNETLRLLNKNKANGPANGGGGRKVSEVVSYRNLREIPPSSRMAIQV